jgi:hypothetical protein
MDPATFSRSPDPSEHRYGHPYIGVIGRVIDVGRGVIGGDEFTVQWEGSGIGSWSYDLELAEAFEEAD